MRKSQVWIDETVDEFGPGIVEVIVGGERADQVMTATAYYLGARWALAFAPKIVHLDHEGMPVFKGRHDKKIKAMITGLMHKYTCMGHVTVETCRAFLHDVLGDIEVYAKG